jgi:glycerol kinase
MAKSSSPTAPIVLGIDQGTTGTTVVAYDERLRPLAQAYRALPNRYPRPGWVEQEPGDVVTSVVEAVAEVLPHIGGPRAVVAAGLANQGESVVAWDSQTGEPLSPVIVWSDERGREVSDRLRDEGHAERIRALTGLYLDPYFSAAKLRWLLDHNVAVRAAAERGALRVGTLDAWLAYQLGGGRHLTDHSTASRTQLAGLGSGAWETELLTLFGVPLAALPEIQPTIGDWGDLAHAAWGGALPWRASLVDQPAALAGHGCVAPGEVKVTYGTGCFVLANAGHAPPAPPEGLLAAVAWSSATRRTFAFDGGVFTAGTAMQWLRGVGLITDVAETAELANSVPDTGGVRFLPAITGLGAPWWSPDARGIFSGITASTTRAHLIRAVFDAIAYRVRDILEAIWVAYPDRPSVLRVDGGLTKNGYLMQRQADLLGLTVAVDGATEATARGAAALAAIGVGFLSERDITSLVVTGASYEPMISADRRDTDYAAWRAWATRAIALAEEQ